MRWLIMKKISIAILLLGMLSVATPVYATDNISITSANLTLTSGNVTITGLEEAITTAATSISDSITQQITDWTELIVALVIMLGLAAIAYFGRDRALLLLPGLAFMFYGFDYWTTDWKFSVLMVIVGIFFIGRAFTRRDIA